jgi:hypothetical protein
MYCNEFYCPLGINRSCTAKAVLFPDIVNVKIVNKFVGFGS